MEAPFSGPRRAAEHLDAEEPDQILLRWANGEREAGSNIDARHLRGLEAMTNRWMGMSLPPDEEWVVVRYLPDSTREAQFRLAGLHAFPRLGLGAVFGCERGSGAAETRPKP